MCKPEEQGDQRADSSAASEHRRVTVALIPFMLAAIAVVVAACGIYVTGWSRNFGGLLVSIAGAVLVFDIPVCVCVLVHWIRTGQPPPLHLSPLIPCREDREFHRRLRERPKLDDDEFYEAYFAAAKIPREVPLRLRRLVEEQLGLDLGGVHPDDNLIWADGELDFAEVLYEIEGEFGVAIPLENFAMEDARFCSLVELIATGTARKTPDSKLQVT